MSPAEATSSENTKVLRDLSEIDFVEIGWVLAIGIVSVTVLKWLMPRLTGLLPDRYRFYLLPWQPILRLLILVVVIVYLTSLFIEPTPQNILTLSGASAVAVGFAFKDYVSSLIAGVVVLFERPYRTGDWIELGGTYGEVTGLELRAVRLRTPDDSEVSIPHSQMWTSAISNANSGLRELMCVADFYLDPEHDGARVREALEDVALTSPYLKLDRNVLVIARETPWGTHYRLKAYPIDGRDQFLFTTDLTLRGKAALARLGARPATAPAAPELAETRR